MTISRYTRLWDIKFPLYIRYTDETIYTPQEFYRSFHWRIIKHRYYKTHKYRCRICGKTHKLHLNHLTYRHIKKYAPKDYCYLCEKCHRRYHRIVNFVAKSDYYYPPRVILRLLRKPRVFRKMLKNK